MDSTGSSCICLSDEDEITITNVIIQPENQQSNLSNETNQCVIDKSELKKILQTVSKFNSKSFLYKQECKNNSAGDTEHDNDDEFEIVDDIDCFTIDDSDEVQIVSDVICNSSTQQKNPKKISIMSVDNSPQNCSSSAECITDEEVAIVNANSECKDDEIVERVSEECFYGALVVTHTKDSPNDCVPISDSEVSSAVMTHILKKIDLTSNIAEKCTVKNTVETSEIQENEIPGKSAMDDDMDIASESIANCKDEIILERVSEECLHRVPVVTHTKDSSNDCLLISNSEVSSSMTHILKEIDLTSNIAGKCIVKNTVETSEIQENEIPSESAMSDDMDITNESIENRKDDEIILERVSEECFHVVPVVTHTKDSPNDCVPISDSKVNSASMTHILIETDISSNIPEKCTVENTVETSEMQKNEISSESAAGDDMDIINESTENCLYDFKYAPTQIAGSWKEFNSGKNNNFTKGCKWAPDGSCILTCSDDNKLRIYNLPSQLWDTSQCNDVLEMDSVLKISEGGLIYDYCWYPFMNSNDATSCVFVSTSRKSTVHMWDAYTGQLRSSYISINHLDELVTPHSLCFDSDGEKLFCGFQNMIRIFDVSRPGREFEERPTYAYKTGQCGIISCFAFTSTDKNISAAGSYCSSIGLYSEPHGQLSCLLEGQPRGITQLQFSPDGKYLYSAGRKDPEILCWDLRNYGTVLFSLRRSYETHQRLYFDISKCGKYVVSGNQNGVVSFWDVTAEPKVVNEDDYSVLIPEYFFLAHKDCVNGVSLHPFYPLLCTSSGERKVPELLDDDSEEIFSTKIKEENSLCVWYIGKRSI